MIVCFGLHVSVLVKERIIYFIKIDYSLIYKFIEVKLKNICCIGRYSASISGNTIGVKFVQF